MVPTELNTGEATSDPPVAALYQVIPVVAVKALLASIVWMGLVWHWVMFPLLVGAGGAAVMVSVTGVRLTLEQVPFEYRSEERRVGKECSSGEATSDSTDAALYQVIPVVAVKALLASSVWMGLV